MKLLDRYTTTRCFKVNHPLAVVSSDISRTVKNCSITDNQIDIVLNPSFFDPFAGRGNIRLHLKPAEDESKTDITCEIRPTSISPQNFYPVILVLSLWTVATLIVSQTTGALITIVTGWSLFIIMFHCLQLLNRGKLENEIKFVLDHLNNQTFFDKVIPQYRKI